MPGSTLTTETHTELSKLVTLLAHSAGKALGSLTGQDVRLELSELSVTNRDRLMESLESSHAAVRAAIESQGDTGSFLSLVGIPDARTLCGMVMMSPDETIEQNRNQGTLEEEELTAFGEIANVLCSGIGDALRETAPDVDVRLEDHSVLLPEAGSADVLPPDVLICCTLEMKIGDYPGGTAFFVLDHKTAESWNKGPLAETDADLMQASAGTPMSGAVNSYGTSATTLKLLRASCKQLGLDLRTHTPAQIPNPAAHPGEIVLIDVPSYEERRMDWCRRIKDYGSSAKVALLLHHPCRSAVKRAYLSKADAILGLPITEDHLARKLAALIEP